MTRDEALQVVGMVVNSWPSQRVWTADEITHYADGILALDAAETTRAVARAQKELDYRPAVAELRRLIRAERRATFTSTVPVGHVNRAVPEWVFVWKHLRDTGNQRPLPQQDGAEYAPDTMTTAEYEQALEAWKQAGSPKRDPLAGVVA